MRTLSAAVVMLSGAVTAAAATSPGLPDQVSGVYGLTGAVILMIGLVAWAVAYFRDGPRS